MAIAAFANKTFQVSSKKIYTFDEFSTGTALQTEKQDVAGKKPSTYIKGPDLDTMSFTIPLSITFGNNVLYEYDSWKAIMAAQKAYRFILGNKPVGGKWLLTSVALVTR
ncbi:phage tail protein [Ruminiclostridium josui]|uniref:phage tail protein n=1 Tax=Ruminiclostridium josui TaxID=1499 RepID=UPI0006D28F55|nr:phage tail protein [Ruminiclostridium josui]